MTCRQHQWDNMSMRKTNLDLWSAGSSWKYTGVKRWHWRVKSSAVGEFNLSETSVLPLYSDVRCFQLLSFSSAHIWKKWTEAILFYGNPDLHQMTLKNLVHAAVLEVTCHPSTNSNKLYHSNTQASHTFVWAALIHVIDKTNLEVCSLPTISYWFHGQSSAKYYKISSNNCQQIWWKYSGRHLFSGMRK